MGRLFTIGYSGHSITSFVAVLLRHEIAVICDVRSAPFSVYKPDFSRAALKRHLNDAGLKYIFMGDALGARPADRSCYVDGQAVYDRIAGTDAFRAALDRLKKGGATLNLALMCSERDPTECHRAILVAHRLGEQRDAVVHVHTDGMAEPQTAFDARLVALRGLTPPPLLALPGDWEAAVAEAYKQQGAAIAFREQWPSTEAAA